MSDKKDRTKKTVKKDSHERIRITNNLFKTAMKDQKEDKTGLYFGIAGIVFILISLIRFAMVLGPLAIICGIIAIVKKHKIIGSICIIMGLFSMLVTMRYLGMI